MTEQQDIKEIEVEVKKKNPLLERTNKFPGEAFRLPSNGFLYTNGELDEEVVNGEVVVYPMTTLDEIYMRTPDMLFQGSAIDVVFKRCIPQIKKPLKLFANDVDFLLTCLRKVSYGDQITITHDCPVCQQRRKEKEAKEIAQNNGQPLVKDKIQLAKEAQENKSLEYGVPLSHFIKNAKVLEESDMKNLHIKLSTGNKISLRPSTFEEMVSLFQVNDNNITTPEAMNDLLIQTLMTTIADVDGIVERPFIEEWLRTLPRKVIEEFSTKLEKVNKWGSTFDYKIKCKKCGTDQTLTTQLNPLYFFMLPSGPTTA